MNTSRLRRLIFFGGIATVLVCIISLIHRAIPYDDGSNIFSTEISVDSIRSMGPMTAIYDKTSNQYYWLKSYTSFNHSELDTLKSKKARIRYMKILKGTLEKRIVWMQVDSIVVFDQIIKPN